MGKDGKKPFYGEMPIQRQWEQSHRKHPLSRPGTPIDPARHAEFMKNQGLKKQRSGDFGPPDQEINSESVTRALEESRARRALRRTQAAAQPRSHSPSHHTPPNPHHIHTIHHSPSPEPVPEPDWGAHGHSPIPGQAQAAGTHATRIGVAGRTRSWSKAHPPKVHGGTVNAENYTQVKADVNFATIDYTHMNPESYIWVLNLRKEPDFRDFDTNETVIYRHIGYAPCFLTVISKSGIDYTCRGPAPTKD